MKKSYLALCTVAIIIIVYAVSALASEYEATKQELIQTNVKLEESLKENKQLRAEHEALQESFKELQLMYQELDTQNKALQEQVTAQETSLTSLQKENEELKKKRAAMASKSTMPSRGSSSVAKSITMTATAYTAYCNGCSGKTFTGIDLRANPDAKVIAVDPNIIPLGSKVWVEGYGYAIAADKGGAIKGHIIDVFIPNKSDALTFGRRTVEVRVLN